MSVRHPRTKAAVAMMLAFCLAGCATNAHSSTPTTSPPAPPKSAVPLTTVSPTQPTPAPATTLVPQSPTCAVSDLRTSLTAAGGSAGAFHYQLIFNNSSASTCTLYGFPGVSFLDGRGHQIGPAAQEGPAAVRQLVRLAPGQKGYAGMSVTDPGIPPCAGPGNVAQIRVYPPASFVPALVTAPAGMQVCTSPNTASYVASTVAPITAASSPG
jgi:Protein of unknown function (DUF4232)